MEPRHHHGRALLVTAFLGVILGGIVGLGASAYSIALNRYVHYGMYRLAALRIQEELLFYVPSFCAGMAAVMGAGLLVSRLLGKGRDLAFPLASLAAIVGAVLIAINLVLKSVTDYSLWRGAKVAGNRVVGLFAGRVGFSDLGTLIDRRPLELFLGIVGIAGVVILCIAAGRISWKRVEDFAVRRSRVLGAAALAWLALLGGLSTGLWVHSIQHPLRGPNFIVVVVDCMRFDHLGCYGYERPTSPSIDALAGNGVRFTRAYSSAPWTKPSICTVFTSLHPNLHGAVDLFDVLPLQSLTVAEILRNRGYETIFLNGGNLNISSRFNVSQGFEVLQDLPEGTDARQLIDQFISLRKRMKNGPFLAYLHFMDVHLPYYGNRFTDLFTDDLASDKFAPGKVTVHKTRFLTSEHEISEADREYLVGLYDGEIRFVDENIARLVRFLKEEGLFDNTLLFITADHGEEFWEHGNFEHGHSLYEELIHVPLIVAGGEVVTCCSDLPTGLLHLAPTLIDLAGLPTTDRGFTGKSFAGVLEGHEGPEPGSSLFATGTLYGPEKYSLIEEDLKFILNTPNETAKLVLIGPGRIDGKELYRLSTDPAETRNLIEVGEGMDDPAVSRLEADLESHRKASPRFERRQVLPDENLKEKLRSVGYL